MDTCEANVEQANDPIVEIDAEGYTELHPAENVSLPDIGPERLAFRDDEGRLYIASVPGLKVEVAAASQAQ